MYEYVICPSNINLSMYINKTMFKVNLGQRKTTNGHLFAQNYIEYYQ
jgi:hypothetical protein